MYRAIVLLLVLTPYFDSYAHDGTAHLPEHGQTFLPAIDPVGPQAQTDLCPEDITKESPGVCGCGTSDTDANSNDVFDCLTNRDLKDQLITITDKAAKLKVSSTESKRRALLRRAKSLKRFTKTWQTQVVLTEATPTITAWASRIERSVNKLVETDSSKFTQVRKVLLRDVSTLSTRLSRTQLFLGTGEYSPQDDWDAVLRFDNIEALTSTANTPSGTVPLKSVLDSSSISLNFGHALFIHEDRNELFVASLFTTAGNAQDCVGGPGVTQLQCGSIGVISNASAINGSPQLTRHIYGSNTQINQPHGLFIDTVRNDLYVANTFGDNILVWNDATTADGNIAPDRVISYSSLGRPVHVFVESSTDQLFVVSMGTGITQKGAAVLIFNNASTLNGEVTPNVRIFGPNTRLDDGNNQTTHNVWYDAATGMLIVGHHTNEILIFDLSSVDLNAAVGQDLDIAPRVIKVHEMSDDSDQYEWSAYGLFYVSSTDQLFVSVGNTRGGTSTRSGPPGVGLTTHVVRVYDHVSDTTTQGLVTPTKNIYWSNVTTYYPPQPLWISVQ